MTILTVIHTVLQTKMIQYKAAFTDNQQMYLPYHAGTLSLPSLPCLYLISCAFLICYACIYYTYLVCYDYSVVVFYVYPVCFAYLVCYDFLKLLCMPVLPTQASMVYYVYLQSPMADQQVICFLQPIVSYALILCLTNPAAVPSQSPLPTMVFYAYTVPCVCMHRIDMSSNPTQCATQSPVLCLHT